MIKSFRHRGIEQFFKNGSKAGIQPKHAEKLRRQLFALDNAMRPQDMNAPGWRLHLRGTTPFWWTIRIITEVFMRMFDPPHPGTVLKDYLGNVSVTAAAAH